MKINMFFDPVVGFDDFKALAVQYGLVSSNMRYQLTSPTIHVAVLNQLVPTVEAIHFELSKVNSVPITEAEFLVAFPNAKRVLAIEGS